MPQIHRLLLPVLAVLCPLALAQVAARPEAPVDIRIGESSVSLAGPWKFAPGDSPRAGGGLLWASPEFDDRAWYSMDLRSERAQIDPGYGNPEFVTGWTDRGFPKLAGFAWYRLRVHIADPAQKLAIKMPDHVDDAYQVFANGKFLGEFGHFKESGVECFRSRAITFALPPPDDHGDILLAVRFYMEPWVLVNGNSGSSGGMHEAPLIGRPALMDSIAGRERGERILSVQVGVAVSLFMLVAAAGAFWIWLIDRPRRTFLWLTCGLVLTALNSLLLALALFTYVLNQVQWEAIDGFAMSVGMICWILFWREWFSLSSGRGVKTFLAITLFVEASVSLMIQNSTRIALSTLMFAMVAEVASMIVLGLMLAHAVWQGARRDRVGALVASPAFLLLAFSLFSPELLNVAGIRTSVFVYGIQFAAVDVALALLVLVTGALGLRRFIGSQVSQKLERQTIDQDLEQARELQQRVLVPEANTSALFAVQTAYHPARTVGGDFFQVIPYPDGSLLVVVGDVSGKGMAAAMLVAVLVGAIRTRADETSDPAEILRTLNERLLGRAGSHFATCVAAHLSPRGHMTVANAGHLPPYVNGVALDLPGSMPLGILRDSRPDLETVELAAGDCVTFLTDGVLEARNAAGQLLGFEQTARLSSQPAESIAEAAIRHGQDDDITVVGVRVTSMVSEPRDSRFMQILPA